MLDHRQLKRYRYNATNNSFVYKFFLSKIVNFIVEFIPPTISPNLITITGFISCTSAFTVLNLMNMFSEKKNFAFLYCSLAIVVYWICDGLDGKQARKTK
ncbi:CDP-diacylglycerol--serine O-phosphatidyltransferase, partial [Cucumispora dikerogammari]